MNKKLLLLWIMLLTWIVWFLNSCEAAGNIGDVSLRFCNNTGVDEKKLLLNISGQESKDICMKLANWSNEDLYVNLSFVDWTITNDSDQKKACKNQWENQNFWQYVKWNNEPVLVPAGKQVITNTSLSFPEEVAGEIHGCVTYFITNKTKDWEMFTIMVRRASFIDAVVKGTVSIWLGFLDMPIQENNLSKNSKILSFFSKEENKLYIQSSLRNKWTAEQKIKITWTINWLLGYEKIFMQEDRTIFGKETTNLNSTVDNLPFYKGPFTITYNVEYNTNIVDWVLTDTNQTWVITESTSIIVITAYTYISIAILLLIIVSIIIIVIIKKHKKSDIKSTTKTNHAPKNNIKKSIKK